MFLTPDQLEALTHRVRPSAQMRALDKMGIKYLPRPDGTPAVSCAHVDKVMGAGTSERLARKTQPNLAMVS